MSTVLEAAHASDANARSVADPTEVSELVPGCRLFRLCARALEADSTLDLPRS